MPPTLVSISGNAIFGIGEQTQPASVAPNARLGLKGFDESAASAARRQAFQELLTFDSGASLIREANRVMRRGVDDAAQLSKALNGAPALKTAFPANNALAAQMQQVARFIQVRENLSMNRQIFFCSLGGFDTHAGQLGTQDALLQRVSQALGAYYEATQELGVERNVTVFSESDFSRTMVPNTNGGSDHAWDGHHLVMGGAVKGGEVWGGAAISTQCQKFK